MRQVRLGQTDIKVGAISYGCWRFAGTDVADARSKIEAALDVGMTLIDTADIYGFGTADGFGGAERLLGDVLRSSPGLRERMVLTTKGGITPPVPYDSSYEYLTGAIDASLERLNLDSVDLYQIHRPDLLARVDETARALEDMVKAGKTKYVGVSNFTVPQTRALQAHLPFPLVSAQPEFSAWEQAAITDGTLDWCSETGASCLAWSPLAGGSLATGTAPDHADKVRYSAVIAALDSIAEHHNINRTQAAIAFALRHPGNVIPIVGTQRIDRIEEAAAAAAITLSRREWYDVIEARRGEKLP